jgi:homoserine kinase type II
VVNVDGRQYCLRRWPNEHPTPERLRLIHAVLGLVSFEMPIVAFPLRTATGSTVVECRGERWELTHWLPGTADYHTRPNRERLWAAMRALAKFHNLAVRYTRRMGPAKAVEERLWQLASMQEKGLAIIEQSLGVPLNSEVDGRARRLLDLARCVLERSIFGSSLGSARELLLQPAIRDVHHDHVLYVGDEVTGLIDFGAMRIDTPLTDVARLVGSLVGDVQEARRAALDAYSEIRQLNHEERRLIDALDESGLVLGGLNWLMWLYVERRDMGPVEPIVTRLDELLARLGSRAIG